MVRTPLQSNQRPRSSLYVPLRQGPQSKAGNPTEFVHGVPPPNGWPLGTEKPMGRTISASSNLRVTRRLDPLDGSGNGSAQQPEELDNRLITQSNPSRVRPELDTLWKGDDKPRPGGKAHGNLIGKEGTSN